MRTLFDMIGRAYAPEEITFIRRAARCIILNNGKVAMVHSRKYNYYKFPGGGIEENESELQAAVREAREEAGLVVIPETLRPYGRVRQLIDGKHEELYIQDNSFFLCSAETQTVSQDLDGYERDEGFTLEWMDPDEAIAINRFVDHRPKQSQSFERESRVLEYLKKEGYFD